MNSFGVNKIMEVDGTLLTILGVSAGILILTGWVEQVYKGYTTKSMKDISKFLMIFIAAGSILWLIYGAIVADVFIIGTNGRAYFDDYCFSNEKKISKYS